MRTTTTVILLLITMTAAQAVQTGYCTGTYTEKGPDWQEGLIQEGDVYEYHCELPSNLGGDEPLEIELSYKNAYTRLAVLTPRILTGTTLVIFP